MAFAHTSGVANTIVDWFSTFEAWITGTIGWTAQSGSGTTNLVLSSDGESSTLTKLFVNIWRGAAPNFDDYVYGEVRDDAAGTNKTSEGGYMRTGSDGNTPFNYWMTADKNAIVIVFETFEPGIMYLGMVDPFVLGAPDETYYMIASGAPFTTASVLRRFSDDAWDVDINLSDNWYIDETARSDYDNTFTVGVYNAGEGQDVVGSLYHIGCFIGDTALNPEDTLVSDLSGGTSTWKVFYDRLWFRFALQTGGTLPSGTGDGTYYAATSGVVTSQSDFISKVKDLLEQVGWTSTNIAPDSGYEIDYVFHSNGESGSDDVYVRVYYLTYIYSRAQDGPGASPAHITTDGNTYIRDYHFPLRYWICADRDCVAFGLENAQGNAVNAHWVGLVIPFTQNLPSVYRTACIWKNISVSNAMNVRVLREHGGDWDQAGSGTLFYGDGSNFDVDSPSFVDDSTYFVWPVIVFHPQDILGSPNKIVYGRAKYIYHMNRSGAGISHGDTLTIGSRTFTTFHGKSANWTYESWWAIRTDKGLYSASSSSSCSSSDSSISASSSSSFSSSSSSFSSSSFSSSSSSTCTGFGWASTLQGVGSPNYLWAPLGLDVYTISGTEYALVGANGEDGMTIIDISDPSNMSFISKVSGTYTNTLYTIKAYTIGGTEYAVVVSGNAESDNAISIIDISTPAAPSVVSWLRGIGSPNYLWDAAGVDVYTIGGTEYAFVASHLDNALTIFDISTPAVPSHVSTISGAGSPNYLDGARYVRVHEISGTEYAFVCSEFDTALTIFDVSTPAVPSHVGVISGAGSPNYLDSPVGLDVETIWGTPYVFVGSDVDDALSVFDVTDPSSPVLVDTYIDIGAVAYTQGARRVDVQQVFSSYFVFLASGLDNAMTVFDCTDPTNLTHYGVIVGAGSPYYLDSPYDIKAYSVGGTMYAFATAYGDSALIAGAMCPTSSSSSSFSSSSFSSSSSSFSSSSFSSSSSSFSSSSFSSSSSSFSSSSSSTST